MAIKSGFFNSVSGDRRYDANWFASYFASFIGNGVFPTPSNSLQIIAGTNMTTVVKAGKGWINGYFINNDSDYVLQHSVADGTLKRIDRVVMRLNFLTRQIEIDVKKGTFASNPVAPTLQRDTDYVELALADVLINNGATVITQANITDTRLNNSLCGIVHGVVDQVDTTTIFNQYQAWSEQTKNEIITEFDDLRLAEQTEFETWFANLEDILDGDVAANLANRILVLENGKVDKTSIGNVNGVAPLNDEMKVPEEFLSSVGRIKEITRYSISSMTPSITFQNLNLEDYSELYLSGFDLRGGTNLFNITFNGITTASYLAQTYEKAASVTSLANNYNIPNGLASGNSLDSTVYVEIKNEPNSHKSVKSHVLQAQSSGLLSYPLVGGWVDDVNLIKKITLTAGTGQFTAGTFILRGVKR